MLRPNIRQSIENSNSNSPQTSKRKQISFANSPERSDEIHTEYDSSDLFNES